MLAGEDGSQIGMVCCSRPSYECKGDSLHGTRGFLIFKHGRGAEPAEEASK